MKILKLSPKKIIMWYLGLWIPIIILATFVGGEVIENVAVSYLGIGGILSIMGVAKLLFEELD